MIALPDATAFELGFAPAAAAILSLGPQNMLLLRQGLSGHKVLIVIGTCYGSDLGLVLLGTVGLGAVVTAYPLVPPLLRVLGASYLLLMSTHCFTRAIRREPARLDGTGVCVQRIFFTALVVSALNPLAWVESVLVLGAVSSIVPSNLLIFVAGASLGTLCRLSLLAFGARVLRPMFLWPLFRRGFDTLAGLAMAGMATLLLTEFLL